MEQTTDKSVQIRKKYSKVKGGSQKPFNFRLDNDNVEWLSRHPNKGRYINNLIREDRQRSAGE